MINLFKDEQPGVLIVITFVFICLLPLVIWGLISGDFKNRKPINNGRITTVGKINE